MGKRNELKRLCSKPFHGAFLYLAKFITKFSWLALLLVLLVLGLCGIGWQNFAINQDIIYWNSPSGTTGYDYKGDYTDDWGPDTRILNTFVEYQGNLVNKTQLLNLLINVVYPILGMTVNYNGQNLTLGDVCYKSYPVGGFAPCSTQSVFSVWNYNATILAADPNIQVTIAKNLQFVNSTLGGKKFDPTGKIILSATALRFAVLLNATGDIDDMSAAFENTFEHILMPGVYEGVQPLYDMFWLTSQTAGEDNKTVLDPDKWWYVISGILVTFATIMYFGKPHPVHSHILLAIGSTSMLYIAVFCGMGLGVGIQTRGAPVLVYYVPFLSLVTGMNNIFMLYSMYMFLKRRDGLSDPAALIERVYAKSHARLMISLVLGFIGTMVGCASTIPLVQYVARTSMCVIWITWFATVVSFGVLLYWDALREAAGRMDLCPFIKGEVSSVALVQGYDADSKHLADHSLILEESLQEESFFERFLRRVYIPGFLRLWPLHIIVVGGFFALWIVGLYMTTQIDNKLSYDVVFKSDSALIRTVNDFPVYFPEIGSGNPVHLWMGPGIDYGNVTQQAQLDALGGYLATAPWTTGTVVSWWVALSQYLAFNGIPRGNTTASIYAQINIFLNTIPAGNIFGGDTTRDANGLILLSRWTIFQPVYMDMVYDADLYDDLKKGLAANTTLPGIEYYEVAFPLFESLLNATGFKLSQMIAGLVMLGLAIVLAIVYKSWVAIFVGMDILGAYFIIFGFLYVTNFGLAFARNMVVALATGSCGNSSSIFCFEFQRAPGDSGKDKAQFAFTLVASYIYHITLVGVLAVVILFNGPTAIYKQMAGIYICCVLVGAAHSFIFLPSITALVEKIRGRGSSD